MISVAPFDVRKYLFTELQRGTGDVPVLPKIAMRALELAQSPNFSFDGVSTAAEQFPPMAGRVLSLANSAYYSRGERVTNVKSALVRLGIDAVRDALYQTAYASALFVTPGYAEILAASFRHAVVVSLLTRRVCALTRREPDLPFLAALFHDIGRSRCLRLCSKVATKTTLEDVARATDAHHTMAGAALLKKWRLPLAVAEACQLHHAPGTHELAAIVAATDTLAHVAENPPRANVAEAMTALASVGVAPERTDELLVLAAEATENAPAL